MLKGPLLELDLGVVPSPSGGAFLLLHAGEDGDCLLVFRAFNVQDKGNPVALATFADCLQSVFGYPNDEAYRAVDGAGYGFYEILESEWSAQLTEFNQLRFPGSQQGTGSRHFFVGSHDDSAQFLASDVRVEIFSYSFAGVAREALRRISRA